MHPQRREVRVKNDGYEREQLRLAKQKKRMVVLINDHIFAFCAVRKCARILELMRTLCLTSHTFHTSFVAHG